MRCPNCGADLKPGIAFCTTCGNKVSAPAPAQNAPPIQQHTHTAAPAIHHPGESVNDLHGDGYHIEHRPSFSVLTINLHPEQSILAESGAMVAMSANIELQSQMKGGVMGALKRAVTGESVFQSTFTSRGAGGEVLLSPSSPGDIIMIPLNGHTYFVQGSSYLASDMGLQMDTQWGGLKSFFAREGLFMIRVSGQGRLFVSSFGAILKKTLAPGERYVVDTGHIVAFEQSVQYTLRKASQAGWLRSVASGEGVVAEYNGPGEIYLQTRNIQAFASWIFPFFPKQSGGGGGFNFNLGS